MCGVCGIVGRPDDQLIKSMLARIAHRGPDDEGVYIAKTSGEQRVGLGHRRLSIIDLSSAGHEPMSDASGRIWLTFNGEIYNFKQLRRELEASGHRFNSNTDAEVIMVDRRQPGGREDNSLKVFQLLTLELWHRAFIDGVA